MANKTKFQAIKGTRDLLPPETELWNRVEATAREVFGTFGFGEMRPPIFEPTELFARAVGGETDIVSKEMYTFSDSPAYSFVDRPTTTEQSDKTFELNAGSPLSGGDFKDREEKRRFEGYQRGQFISLRPEATASVCRAYIEHNMHAWVQPVKLYYIGPMFRRERPQKGRYRQFFQIGAEVLETLQAGQGGAKDVVKDAAVDAEVIDMVMVFFARLELPVVQLEINSIGHSASAVDGKPLCRRAYVEKLRAALVEVKDQLGEDSRRRIETNPLRVLDSKLEHEQPIIENLPRITDHLCEDCRKNFAEVKRQLDLRGVTYKENWRLVRGLDYYMRTTFEITAQGLGSQNAVCGGGRYDGLVELLGGPATKGIGFAIGEDRLILSLLEARPTSAKATAGKEAGGRIGCDVYVAWMGASAQETAIKAAKMLREAGLRVELPPVEQKFGKALGQADRVGARFALILGEDEVASGKWTVKTLADGGQEKVSAADVVQFVKKKGEKV
jgi:histidyl-tRNA synthetase